MYRTQIKYKSHSEVLRSFVEWWKVIFPLCVPTLLSNTASVPHPLCSSSTASSVSYYLCMVLIKVVWQYLYLASWNHLYAKKYKKPTTTQQPKAHNITWNICLTLRKCLVARKRAESVSCAFAHCSASGVTASRQSWQTSELILITSIKESTPDCSEIVTKLPSGVTRKHLNAYIFQDIFLL